MKTNADSMIMWAGQHQRVIDTLKQDGVYYVKKSYVKQKYQESAWIFENAYSFITSHAQTVLPRPCSEAENMVWMYRDKNWLEAAGEYKLLQLQIPAENMVIFDRRKWEAIVGMRYMGSDKEAKAFNEELERMGINSTIELFRTSFYPMQKRKLIQSWERIMNSTDLEEKYFQGGTWCLKKEWILNWDEISR